MMRAPVPESFDWVKARAECSLDRIFQLVCLGLETDVKRRNEQLSPNLTPFSSAYEDRDFAVFRRTQTTHKLHRFSRTENGIKVTDTAGKPILQATLTLCDDGLCRLKIGDVECEFWQFRRRALESLLFDPEV